MRIQCVWYGAIHFIFTSSEIIWVWDIVNKSCTVPVGFKDILTYCNNYPITNIAQGM